MPNLGFSELVIIFVIALLVFGPKKLPELGKSLGKGLREFKRATEDLKSNWDDQMREAEHSIQETKSEIMSTTTTAPSHTVSAAESQPAEPIQNKPIE
ncbi:MAG TPA: twin-arginine translocase TatA/TatE family subunit [Terriglobia bacterium]|nr:twin-arginine translocase TatA/TatE family subunit [Terriglobia bacterium]